MRNLKTPSHRIIWLLINEIRTKIHLYGMVLFVCFATLLYVFYNPEFSLSELVFSITNPGTVRTYSNLSMTSFYYGGGPIQSHILKYYLLYFPNALIFSGCILSGLSFIEYSSIDSRRFQISLPATTTEKWMVKVLWYSILYPVLFHVTFYLFAQFIYTLGINKGMDYVRVSFFDPYIWNSILRYIPISFMVIMGTVFFRKYSFIKLAIVAYAFYTFMNVVFNISLTQLFPNIDSDAMHSYFNANSFKNFLNKGELMNYGNSILHMFPKSIQQLPSLIWYYLAGFIALAISYLRFREIEA